MDPDLQRILHTAEQGLLRTRAVAEQDDDEDFRLHTFLVVGIVNWADHATGTEREGTVIFSESRHHYTKLGILTAALDRLQVDREDDLTRGEE